MAPPPRRIAAMRESAVAERRRTRVAELEFTGCEPVRVSETEILGPEWEGRKLEYWHAATETAWMVGEPASRWHERPARRLARLLERIVEARGSDVECLGSTDLRIREPDGALTDLMQADETVYLHPGGANLPLGSQLIVGEDAYPDVVLEVDNTTDVRRGKLVAYAEWGFPEVWVEVPKMASPSRPAGLSPGLTIHLLEEGRYRESSESRAFPGWGAEEIHRALNEPVMSEDTKKDLRRVGRALGEREGTVPEDELLLTRMERRAEAANGGSSCPRVSRAEVTTVASRGSAKTCDANLLMAIRCHASTCRERGRGEDAPEEAVKHGELAEGHVPGTNTGR